MRRTTTSPLLVALLAALDACAARTGPGDGADAAAADTADTATRDVDRGALTRPCRIDTATYCASTAPGAVCCPISGGRFDLARRCYVVAPNGVGLCYDVGYYGHNRCPEVSNMPGPQCYVSAARGAEMELWMFGDYAPMDWLLDRGLERCRPGEFDHLLSNAPACP